LIRSKGNIPGQHKGRPAPSSAAVEDRPRVVKTAAKQPILARILLADGDLASRLTLGTLLTAGGYLVDSVGSASEAVDRLEKNEYHLVLADLRAESEDAGQKILAYAREKCYKPATALVTSFLWSGAQPAVGISEHHIAVENEDVSKMLDRVAELIGLRVSRRVNRRIARTR
jgi:CheY-like chemotaxis protein